MDSPYPPRSLWGRTQLHKPQLDGDKPEKVAFPALLKRSRHLDRSHYCCRSDGRVHRKESEEASYLSGVKAQKNDKSHSASQKPRRLFLRQCQRNWQRDPSKNCRLL